VLTHQLPQRIARASQPRRVLAPQQRQQVILPHGGGEVPRGEGLRHDIGRRWARPLDTSRWRGLSQHGHRTQDGPRELLMSLATAFPRPLPLSLSSPLVQPPRLVPALGPPVAPPWPSPAPASDACVLSFSRAPPWPPPPPGTMPGGCSAGSSPAIAAALPGSRARSAFWAPHTDSDTTSGDHFASREGP
jgi:hypothetical protein